MIGFLILWIRTYQGIIQAVLLCMILSHIKIPRFFYFWQFRVIEIWISYFFCFYLVVLQKWLFILCPWTFGSIRKAFYLKFGHHIFLLINQPILHKVILRGSSQKEVLKMAVSQAIILIFRFDESSFFHLRQPLAVQNEGVTVYLQFLLRPTVSSKMVFISIHDRQIDVSRIPLCSFNTSAFEPRFQFRNRSSRWNYLDFRFEMDWGCLAAFFLHFVLKIDYWRQTCLLLTSRFFMRLLDGHDRRLLIFSCFFLYSFLQILFYLVLNCNRNNGFFWRSTSHDYFL